MTRTVACIRVTKRRLRRCTKVLRMASDPSKSDPRECVHCDGPATHKHETTGEVLCCGHASWDIDAKPIRDTHSCEKFYTVRPHHRELECEHRDVPDEPTGDLNPCHETATWDITTSRFPGYPFDPTHPGAPTSSLYCPDHFSDRLEDIIDGGLIYLTGEVGGNDG